MSVTMVAADTASCEAAMLSGLDSDESGICAEFSAAGVAGRSRGDFDSGLAAILCLGWVLSDENEATWTGTGVGPEVVDARVFE